MAPGRVPEIELNSSSLSRHFAAACCKCGGSLLFSIHHVDFAKPAALWHTVAHELSHAISYAHGWGGQHG